MKNISFLLFVFFTLTLKAQEDYPFIWQQGVEALRSGDMLKGIEMMNLYLKGYPNSPYALSNRGMAYYQMGDIENACQDLNLAKVYGFEQRKQFTSYFCDPAYKLNLMKEEYYKEQTLLPENGNRPLYTRRDSLRGALRPERTCFDVYFYDLSVRILPHTKSIAGNNRILFHVLNETSRIQLDLTPLLRIDSIIWKGSSLRYTREYDAIWVDFPEKLVAGTDQEVRVYYKGVPRVAPKPPWDGGLVWKHSGPFTWHIGVACEHLGASAWWPTKDHLSDKPDSMGINIEVPSKYQAVCNGRLRSVTPINDKYTRYEWFVDYPINNYNATFYMGKFVEFTDTIYSLGDTLICRYHVLPKNLEIAREHFKQARDVVDCYNRAFGPFPFWKDNFRMVESPFEGMEHQTAIAYGDAFDNSKNAMTYLNKNYDYIIVHESAHEWWGNSVTASDMADVWLHEGFATYAEYIFLEEKLGYIASIKELQNHMFYIFNLWPMVQHRDVNENSFASGDIYFKGATMLHCLRSIVQNDSLFFGFIKGFYQTYKGQSINSNDFINYSNSYFGADYTPFFRKFLFDKDLPVLSFSYKRTSDGIILKYKWTEVPEDFEMPFAIEYGNGKSERLVATTKENEFLIPDAVTFRFFNLTQELDYVPKFGFTYYKTHFE